MIKKFLFENYIWGICSAVVVCIFPILSLILCFVDDPGDNILPQTMCLVAMAGIIYEFAPKMGKKETMIKMLKIENLLIVCWIVGFIIFDFVLIFFQKYINSPVLKYFLSGYVLMPLSITIIEIVRCIKEMLQEDNNIQENRITNGDTSKV